MAGLRWQSLIWPWLRAGKSLIWVRLGAGESLIRMPTDRLSIARISRTTRLWKTLIRTTTDRLTIARISWASRLGQALVRMLSAANQVGQFVVWNILPDF